MALLNRSLQTFTLLLLLAAVPSALHAQPLTAGEDDVKAAFLYRFGSFIEWPATAFADADSSFVIVVAGADAVAEKLAAITAQRTVHGRRVVVRRASRVDQVGAPQVLFIGTEARHSFDALVATLAGTPVLIVTEIEGAVARGSMIDLVVDDDRVRFDVAPATAAAHGLTVSSRVLAIARRLAPQR